MFWNILHFWQWKVICLCNLWKVLNLVVVEKKTNICFASPWIMAFFNYQFWSLDVQGCSWCLNVIIFWGFNWKPRHVILGLFEAIETIGQALVKNLTNNLLDAYHLKNMIITYIKKWGFKFAHNDKHFQVNCEMWSFGLGRELSRDILNWAFFSNAC